MERIRVAVCDDEETVRSGIGRMLRSIDPEVQIVEFETADALLRGGSAYDILLLDIQMPGENGIDAARQIRKGNAEIPIIFITALKEYVFEAFDVAAFHYLLKPIEPEKLGEVYQRAAKSVRQSRQKASGQLVIHTRENTIAVDREEILYAETALKKVAVHTTSQVIEFYGRIHKLEETLGDGFYRCHRGYLVNLAYIREYRKDRILLQNGDCLLLAKERYADFVDTYMNYLRNGGACFV